MKFKTFIKKAVGWLRREPIRTFKQIRYKVWLSIHQFSFKSREEKLRRVERIIAENPNIYFTPGLVKTGFTDQLIGFDFLYKLGRELGLQFYHIPLSAHRSSDPFLFDPITQNQQVKTSESAEEKEDIFDSLGLNGYLRKHAPLPSQIDKKIPLNLNVTLFPIEGIDSLESLIEEMKVVLYPFLEAKKSILLIFQAEPKTYFRFYRYIKDQKKFEIDYRSIFDASRKKVERQSEFSSHSVNILVHIRQGDTGTVETPWNTFIPVWHEIEGKFNQFHQEREIPGYKRIYPDQFFHFLNDLQEALNPQKMQSVVFSDGYKKTFRWIYKHRRENEISSLEIEKLKMIEPSYDDQKFNKFNNLPSTYTVIGEEVEKLNQLIHSFFDADILVTGTQATLIPKLKAIYGRKDEYPFLILLYHTKKPSLEYVGFRDSTPSLMFVDIEDYEISEISNRVRSYLELRRSKKR